MKSIGQVYYYAIKNKNKIKVLNLEYSKKNNSASSFFISFASATFMQLNIMLYFAGWHQEKED